MALRYGVLPVEGGLDDQPADFIDALKMGLSVVSEAEKEAAKKQREAMENAGRTG